MVGLSRRDDDSDHSRCEATKVKVISNEKDAVEALYSYSEYDGCVPATRIGAARIL